METQFVENPSLYTEKTKEPRSFLAGEMMRYLKVNFEKSPYERKILELGSSSGSLIDELSDLFGTDKANGINIMEKLHRDEKIRQHALAGEPLPLPIASNLLDVVVSTYLFNYVPDWENILRETGRMLRKGGEAFLVVRDKDLKTEAGLEMVDSKEIILPGDEGMVWLVTLKKK